jgi:hypothetical protein
MFHRSTFTLFTVIILIGMARDLIARTKGGFIVFFYTHFKSFLFSFTQYFSFLFYSYISRITVGLLEGFILASTLKNIHTIYF